MHEAEANFAGLLMLVFFFYLRYIFFMISFHSMRIIDSTTKVFAAYYSQVLRREAREAGWAHKDIISKPTNVQPNLA